MQADVVLIQAEQKLMNKTDQLIVLADSSKFRTSASFVVCGLDAIDTSSPTPASATRTSPCWKPTTSRCVVAR